MVVHLPLLFVALAAAAEPAAAPRGTGHFVPKEQRAPVAYETVNGLIFFKATIAGHEVWANLDTGATTTLVDIALTRSAELALAPGNEKLKTLDGEVEAQRLSEEVEIVIPGQIVSSHPRLAAVDLTAVSKVAGRDVDLVVGQDFLKPLAMMIDPSRKIFQFAPSGVFKPPADAIELNLLAGEPPRVEVTIGTQKAIVTIDTGSMGNLALTAEAWSRLVPKDAPTGTAISSGGKGEPRAGKSARLSEIQIGSLKLNDVLVRESPAASGTEGTLGMGILGKFRLVLDIKQGKMWLGASPPPPP